MRRRRPIWRQILSDLDRFDWAALAVCVLLVAASFWMVEGGWL